MRHTTFSHLKRLGLALLAMSAAAACGPQPSSPSQSCPDENRVLLGEHKYCVIDQTIIEKGFDCPPDLSYRHEVPGVNGAVCSDMPDLPKQDIDPLKDLVRDPPGSGSWLDDPEPDPDPMPDPDPDPVTCTTPDPSAAGCDSDADCAAGESCQTGAQLICVPSSCSCDSGSWVCTEDCGELKECAPDAGTTCSGPDPSEQPCEQDADCGGDQICGFSDDDVCVPSGCNCDAATGSWICTTDCGQPRECVDPEPVQPCSDGTQIVCDAIAGPCPTGLIRETVGGCFGECVDPGTCESPIEMCGGTPDPSYQECSVDADCEGDAVCGVLPIAVCVSGGCFCDEASGTWSCTDDCNAPRACQENPGPPASCGDGSEAICNALPDPCPVGQIREIVNGCFGECVIEQTCELPYQTCGGVRDPSYQECEADADCGAGFECLPSDAAICIASTCFCDEATGTWGCTEDCGQPLECVAIGN